MSRIVECSSVNNSIEMKATHSSWCSANVARTKQSASVCLSVRPCPVSSVQLCWQYSTTLSGAQSQTTSGWWCSGWCSPTRRLSASRSVTAHVYWSPTADGPWTDPTRPGPSVRPSVEPSSVSSIRDTVKLRVCRPDRIDSVSPLARSLASLAQNVYYDALFRQTIIVAHILNQ